VGIRCGCQAQVESAGAITVPSKKLFDIVRFLPEAELHCVVHENNWVEIRCENANFKIAGLTRDNYPDVPEFKGERLSIPASMLKEMILRTIFAITQDESRYTLNGAKLIIDSKSVKIVTTDGHRLAYVEKNSEIGANSEAINVLVPRKALAELLKMMEQQLTVELGRDERNLFFRIGKREIVSRTLAGQFPNYEMVLPRGNNQILLCNTAILSDGLKRASIMAEERTRPVKFYLGGQQLEMVAATAEQGESRERMDVEYNGETIAISFNAQYLLDFLGTVQSEKVSIEIKDQEVQVLCRPYGEQEYDYRYVVMPMSV
jgi:DNA polymerase-3 subunit beta